MGPHQVFISICIYSLFRFCSFFLFLFYFYFIIPFHSARAVILYVCMCVECRSRFGRVCFSRSRASYFRFFFMIIAPTKAFFQLFLYHLQCWLCSIPGMWCWVRFQLELERYDVFYCANGYVAREKTCI